MVELVTKLGINNLKNILTDYEQKNCLKQGTIARRGLDEIDRAIVFYIQDTFRSLELDYDLNIHVKRLDSSNYKCTLIILDEEELDFEEMKDVIDDSIFLFAKETLILEKILQVF